MEKRKEEILKIFESVEDGQKVLVENLIDEFVFQEKRLAELRKLPFIRVNPNNKAKQMTTAAQRQYKELSQSYTNIAKVLLSVLGQAATDDFDPVAEFMEKMRHE